MNIFSVNQFAFLSRIDLRPLIIPSLMVALSSCNSFARLSPGLAARSNDAKIRAAAMYSLAESMPSEDRFALLIAGFQDSDPTVQIAALQSFEQITHALAHGYVPEKSDWLHASVTEAVRIIATLLKSTNASVRYSAAESVSHLPPFFVAPYIEEALNVMEKLDHNGRNDVAAFIIAGGESAIPAMANRIEKADANLSAHLAGIILNIVRLHELGSSHTLDPGSTKMAALQKHAPIFIKALTQLLDEREEAMVRVALSALEQFRSSARPALPQVRSLFSSSSDQIVMQARICAIWIEPDKENVRELSLIMLSMPANEANSRPLLLALSSESARGIARDVLVEHLQGSEGKELLAAARAMRSLARAVATRHWTEIGEDHITSSNVNDQAFYDEGMKLTESIPVDQEMIQAVLESIERSLPSDSPVPYSADAEYEFRLLRRYHGDSIPGLVCIPLKFLSYRSADREESLAFVESMPALHEADIDCLLSNYYDSLVLLSALAKNPTASRKHLPAIIEKLSDASPGAGLEPYLRHIDIDDFIPAAVSDLKNTESSTRCRAALIIGSMSTNLSPAVKRQAILALEETLHEARTDDRFAAARSLIEINSIESYPDVVDFYTDELSEGYWRTDQAIMGLSLLGRHARAALPELQRLAEKTGPESAAASAIGTIQADLSQP